MSCEDTLSVAVLNLAGAWREDAPSAAVLECAGPRCEDALLLAVLHWVALSNIFFYLSIFLLTRFYQFYHPILTRLRQCCSA